MLRALIIQFLHLLRSAPNLNPMFYITFHFLLLTFVYYYLTLQMWDAKQLVIVQSTCVTFLYFQSALDINVIATMWNTLHWKHKLKKYCGKLTIDRLNLKIMTKSWSMVKMWKLKKIKKKNIERIHSWMNFCSYEK
jgi:hypothetical protein